MKSIVIAMSLGMSVLAFGDSQCSDLSGVYQTNLPQDFIENVEFQKVEKLDCTQLLITYGGTWHTLLERPVFDSGQSETLIMDGQRHCNSFGSLCYTAIWLSDKIRVQHDEERTANGQGALCKTTEFSLELDGSQALVTTIEYYGCSDGTRGSRKMVFPRYLK